jgi:hypothetical protein
MAEMQGAEQQVLVHKSRRSGSWSFAQLIYWIAGVIEVLLAFRFGLKLLGANAAAGFVKLVYDLSAPVMAPFEAVFGVSEIEGATFEWSALLAILVYAVVAWGLASFIRYVAPSATKTVEAVEQSQVLERHK